MLPGMPMVGETLAGRYRIDATLGAGATAVVYRAHDLRLSRDVAVKVLLANLAQDPLVAGRFDREARALAAAANPGIVAVYDVDHGDPATGREPFFVMELCEEGRWPTPSMPAADASLPRRSFPCWRPSPMGSRAFISAASSIGISSRRTS